MQTDSTQKFTGKARLYQQARPAYAQALLDYLANHFGLGPHCLVADFGSGTGIFTRQLLEKGAIVFAVEPNADMRATAEALLQGEHGFISVSGTEAQSGLPAGSIDLVTAAQAFHWFNVPAFASECQRILRPGGRVALIWNMRLESLEIHQENARIFQKYCPNFHGFGGGIAKREEEIRQFFSGELQTLRFDNPILYDRQSFITRALSASYSLTDGDANFAAYLAELEALFNRYAVNDRLTLPNETVAYLGSLHQPGRVASQIQIRPATVEDAVAISLLNQNDLGYTFPAEQTRRKLEHLLPDTHYRIWVAEAEGAVVGYVQAEEYDTLYEGSLKNILGIAVAKPWRGKGVGKALLQTVERWGRESGAQAVRLVSRESRSEAHAFYFHCGYYLDKKQLNIKKKL